MQYKAYLFDFDYTLANSEKGIVMCFQHVLKNNGYNNVTDDEIKKTIGMTLKDEFTIFTGITDDDELEKLRLEYVAKADEVMVANTKFFPETLPMLERLKNDGVFVGIISTKFRYRIEDTLKNYGVAQDVNIIIGGEDVSVAKPDPQGLLMAIEKLGVSKGEVLYIGDSIIDAKTAQSASVDFAGVTTGTTTKGDFEQYPYKLIMQNLSELI